MISYNKNEDPSKVLDQMCFILKARMMNEPAVERYEHRNTWYEEQWEEFRNDVWDTSKRGRGGKR